MMSTFLVTRKSRRKRGMQEMDDKFDMKVQEMGKYWLTRTFRISTKVPNGHYNVTLVLFGIMMILCISS